MPNYTSDLPQLQAFLHFLQKEYERSSPRQTYISATAVDAPKRDEVVLTDDSSESLTYALRSRTHPVDLLRFDTPELAAEFLSDNREVMEVMGLYNPEIRSIRGLLDEHMINVRAALDAGTLSMASKHGCG